MNFREGKKESCERPAAQPGPATFEFWGEIKESCERPAAQPGPATYEFWGEKGKL
jgi:hypothetical protein